MSSETIVVLGATGQQGGAVVRSLVATGRWKVHALSRNLHSHAARSLAAEGVTVIAANMDDPTSLQTAFTGAYGVYSVQGSDKGRRIETLRGITVANAAQHAGVKHFIYSSVGGADRASGVPHFESKWLVEQHIRSIGLPATIVRPVFFMDNFTRSTMRLVLLALLRAYLPEDKSLQMIATADIGKWVAHAFTHPETFIGMAEEIAGDELTLLEIIATLKYHRLSSGLSFPIPKPLLRPFPDDIRQMFEWFGCAGYSANLSKLKTCDTDLMTLDTWLARR